MREFNALSGYPAPQKPRYVNANLRTIQHRIVASYRDKDFFDGDRNYGYGGLKYDGRWQAIAKNMIKEYNLKDGAKILQLGCERGFLLHDFKEINQSFEVKGTELSPYAVSTSMPSIRQDITICPYTSLPFSDNYFDLVIAIGPVYTLNLADSIQCLKEIQRVGKGKSFITLGSYETEEELRLFRYWTLLGSSMLNKDEWREVLKHVEYSGDYHFNTAKSLNLIELNDSNSDSSSIIKPNEQGNKTESERTGTSLGGA